MVQILSSCEVVDVDVVGEFKKDNALDADVHADVDVEVPERFICPVMLSLIDKPYCCPCCHNSFELWAIKLCIRKSRSCPLCRGALSEDLIVLNEMLLEDIESWLTFSIPNEVREIFEAQRNREISAIQKHYSEAQSKFLHYYDLDLSYQSYLIQDAFLPLDTIQRFQVGISSSHSSMMNHFIWGDELFHTFDIPSIFSTENVLDFDTPLSGYVNLETVLCDLPPTQLSIRHRSINDRIKQIKEHNVKVLNARLQKKKKNELTRLPRVANEIKKNNFKITQKGNHGKKARPTFHGRRLN